MKHTITITKVWLRRRVRPQPALYEVVPYRVHQVLTPTDQGWRLVLDQQELGDPGQPAEVLLLGWGDSPRRQLVPPPYRYAVWRGAVWRVDQSERGVRVV